MNGHRIPPARRTALKALALLGAGPVLANTTAAPAPPPVVVLAQLDYASMATMAEAVELARVVAAKTQSEDGCLHYAYGVDINKPNRLLLSEWWRDEAALEAHLHTPHLREFRLGLRRLGGARGTVKRYLVGEVSDLALPPLDG